MGYEPELVMCDRCNDDIARSEVSDGRALCVGCIIDVCNEVMREQKARPGLATLVVVEAAQYALTNEHKHHPSGRIMVDLPPDTWWAFIAELENAVGQ